MAHGTLARDGPLGIPVGLRAPLLRHLDSSSVVSITFGIIGTVLTLCTIVIAILQLRNTRLSRKAAEFVGDMELGLMEHSDSPVSNQSDPDEGHADILYEEHTPSMQTAVSSAISSTREER
ncbi:hypothetical protein NA57DRAFT_52585 [Rhizodiscina lignyota]|uniref:Uncharacterized protein n=1 Tax=Rhizodiscina lignyota TaxID=1504668 RepID=A0A9P4M9P7_9PEZI|nr:hypothetical protein NA57DRAFT_52585 [Rhizodiscina lignyota]